MIQYIMNKVLIPFLCAACFAPCVRSVTPATVRRASEHLQLKISPNTMKKRVNSALDDFSPIKLNFDDASVQAKVSLIINSNVENQLCDLGTREDSAFALDFADKKQDLVKHVAEVIKESVVELVTAGAEKTVELARNSKHAVTFDVLMPDIKVLTRANGEEMNMLKTNTWSVLVPVLASSVRLGWVTFLNENVALVLANRTCLGHDIEHLKFRLKRKDLSYMQCLNYLSAGITYIPHGLSAFVESYTLNGDRKAVNCGVSKTVDLSMLGSDLKFVVSAGWQIDSVATASTTSIWDKLYFKISMQDKKLISLMQPLN